MWMYVFMCVRQIIIIGRSLQVDEIKLYQAIQKHGVEGVEYNFGIR